MIIIDLYSSLAEDRNLVHSSGVLKKKHILVVQPIIPDYRIPFFEQLNEIYNLDVFSSNYNGFALSQFLGCIIGIDANN